MPNYLAIDYGTKRIGLAWADDLLIAIPLTAIPGTEANGCWDALSNEVKKRAVTNLVFGYPVHMDGKVGERAKEVDRFIEEIEKRLKLPVHRVDERLTSVSARETVGRKPLRKGEDKSGRIDSTAACLILRDFLQA